MEEQDSREEQRREQILAAAFAVATENGLAGLSVRSVAARAQVSHALVLFYFGRKRHLMMALLDRLFADSVTLHVRGHAKRGSGERVDVYALLRQEAQRAVDNPEQTRLFFEFCALGARNPEVHARIDEEMGRYRAKIRAIVEPLAGGLPDAIAGAAHAGVAATLVSWIQGCALQVMMGSEPLSVEEYLTATRDLVVLLAPLHPAG